MVSIHRLLYYDTSSDSPPLKATFGKPLTRAALGLLLLDLGSGRVVGRGILVGPITGGCRGNFLAFSLNYHAIYTHALTFFLTPVLAQWVKEEKTPRDYAAPSVRPSGGDGEQSMTAERELFRRINLLEIVPLSPAPGPVLAVDRIRVERLEALSGSPGGKL